MKHMVNRLAKRASLLLRAFTTRLGLSAPIASALRLRASTLLSGLTAHVAALTRRRSRPTLINHKSCDQQKDQNEDTN